ncbi:MAG: ATP-binding protein [Dehalococcoidia bacterium]|nr:ATP-binding protein [Dehalococcoidia bacterium]
MEKELQQIGRGALDILDGSMAWLLLTNEEEERLDSKTLVSRVPEGRRVLERVLGTRVDKATFPFAGARNPLVPGVTLTEPFFADGLSGFTAESRVSPMLRRLWAGFGATSMGLLPMMNGGYYPTGMMVFARSSDQPLSDRDRENAFSLARQAALSLENARLYSQASQEVEQLKAEAELRTKLLAELAHELRTPLTSLKTSVELLTEDGVVKANNGVGDRLLENVRRSAERLDRLTCQLGDVACLENAKLSPHLEPLDIREVIGEVLELMRPLLNGKAQTIRLEFPPCLPLASVDRYRFERILINLLTNAHKYSPSNTAITLAIRQRGQELAFEVSDMGLGIPWEKCEQIFEPCYRVHKGNGQAAPGGGLGLAITRSLVHQHGGRIWVDSKVGKGSTFYFTLPLQKSNGCNGGRSGELVHLRALPALVSVSALPSS